MILSVNMGKPIPYKSFLKINMEIELILVKFKVVKAVSYKRVHE